MKTAEEWNIIYSGICFNDKAVSGQLLPNPQNVKFIKSVQDDVRNEIKQLIDEMEEPIQEKGNLEFLAGMNYAQTELKNKLGL